MRSPPKHTAGQLRVISDAADRRVLRAFKSDNDQKPISVIVADSWVTEANAIRLALAWNCHDALLEALAGLLNDWEDQFGEGFCDCRPEPENDGHVCNACLARVALAKAGQERREGQ